MHRVTQSIAVGVVLTVLVTTGLTGWSESPGGNAAVSDTVELAGADSQTTIASTTYGRNGTETFRWIAPTDDGGHVLVGFTESFGAGNRDVWVVKVTANGTEAWNRTFGGSAHDWANAAIQTDDGGFLISGTTESYGAGGPDFWLLKVTANGTEEWNQTYGGSDEDLGPEIIATADGGYALVGTTESGNAIRTDVWLVKVSANGTEEWNRTYGGKWHEGGFTLALAGDGGFAIAGYTSTYSQGFDLDAWLVKVDANGTEEWNRTYGGSPANIAFDIVASDRGGFALIGTTEASTFRTGWLRTVNATGGEQWTHEFGGGSGSTYDPSGLIQTTNGDYAFAVNTRRQTESGWSPATASLVTVDASGTTAWNMTFAGRGNDMLFQVAQHADGSYTLVGYTAATGTQDRDGWLVRVENTTANASLHSPHGDEYADSPSGPPSDLIAPSMPGHRYRRGLDRLR